MQQTEGVCDVGDVSFARTATWGHCSCNNILMCKTRRQRTEKKKKKSKEERTKK